MSVSVWVVVWVCDLSVCVNCVQFLYVIIYCWHMEVGTVADEKIDYDDNITINNRRAHVFVTVQFCC